MEIREVIDNIKAYYDCIAINACDEIVKTISYRLNECGIMYRVFSRKKSMESIIDKMRRKGSSKYIPNGIKMQDVFGVRITLYFKDDIDVCVNQLCQLFSVIDKEHDILDPETFKPQRYNYVFRAPDGCTIISPDLSEKCLIDDSFEVQVRTVFSEGWHEVEHDIKYKYQDDWKSENGKLLSRELNGILATLEVCDNGIISVCEDLSYDKYKNHEWESMIRTRFRLRFTNDPIDESIVRIFEEKQHWKAVFRFDRERLIDMFRFTRLPKSCNNAVFLINEYEIKCSELQQITPDLIMAKCKDYLCSTNLSSE